MIRARRCALPTVRARTVPDRSDGGFTLLELLIVVAVMPIIVGGLAFAMVSVYKNQSGISDRLADSNGAQITSATFVKDVQSASTISTSSTPLCGSGTQSLGMKWSVPGSTTTNVSYIVQTVTPSDPKFATQHRLLRRICVDGGSANTSIVGRDLSTPIPTPTIVCNDPPAVSTSNCASYKTSKSFPAGAVATVQWALTAPTTGYDYGFLAAPRIAIAESIGIGPSLPPGVAVIMLGGGTVNMGGGGTLVVNGGVALNGASVSTSGGSVIEVHGDVQTTRSPASSTCPQPDPDHCAISPQPVTGAAVSDPFAGLPAPPTTPVRTISDHVQTGTTLQPGYYDATVTLQSGATVTFAPGIYYLNDCLSATGGTIIAQGVLFYTPPSATCRTEIQGGGTVYASGINDETYGSLWLWQGSSGQVLINGGSDSTFAGALYSPTSTITVGGGGSLAGLQVVANTLNMTGGSGGSLG